MNVKSLSRVWLFATPWTVAHQAPPSMGFSRQEHWSGLPFPSPKILYRQYFWYYKNLSREIKGRVLTLTASLTCLSLQLQRLRSILKKLKLELLYDPIIPLLGIYLKKMKTIIQKDACTLMFTKKLPAPQTLPLQIQWFRSPFSSTWGKRNIRGLRLP